MRLPRAFIASLCLLSPALIGAAEPTHAQAVPAAAQATPSAPIARDDGEEARLLDSFRVEREVLERQADRQATGINNLVQTMLWTIASIVAVAAGVFFWTWGSTRNEMLSSIKAVAATQVRELVEAQALPVRERLTRIQKEIDDLRTKPSSVTWIVRNVDEDNSKVLAQMQSRSINVSTIVPAEGEPFRIDGAELVMISYVPNAEGSRRIRETIRQLRERAPIVPIVIYTFDPARADNRLLPEDHAALAEYEWFVPANFPLQLVAHVSSLTIRNTVEWPDV